MNAPRACADGSFSPLQSGVDWLDTQPHEVPASAGTRYA